MDEHDHDPRWTTTTVGAPESADAADQNHWRARRLRKTIDNRRRQRAKGELLLLGGKNDTKKHTRDATSLRALQVSKAIYAQLSSLTAVVVMPKACM